MAPRRGDHQGPLGVVLALDVDEVLLGVRQAAEDLVEVDRRRLDVEGAGEEADRLGEAPDGEDGDPLDDRGLGGVGRGDEQAVEPLGGGGQGHRQDPLDRPRLARQGQLAHDREPPRPLEGHLPAAEQEPQRDRQVEPAGVLLEVGRGQVDDRPGRSAGDSPS